MKLGFYFKLAADGIRKNKPLYVPYILVSGFMVWMLYMVLFLMNLPLLDTLDSGLTIKMYLGYGIFFITGTSLSIIYEANKFLNKQREHEYGLYNVFGMNKKNIAYVLICENVIVSNISIITGFILGITTSKLAEISLLNLIRIDVNYEFHIDKKALLYTYAFYVILFTILMLISMIRIARLKTIALIKSNQGGEKPPKVNWIFALVGILLIIVIYYNAVTIEYNILVFYEFIIMACLIAIATRLLFVSGSVALCKILKLNKKYYYNKKNYISVSVMSYRMKKNGGQLANICVMSAATLVLILLTSSLYINIESDINNRFKYDLELCTTHSSSFESYNEENFAIMRSLVDDIDNKKDIHEYKNASLIGTISDGNIIPSVDKNMIFDSDVVYIGFISVDDYNKITGKNEKLESGECIIGYDKQKYNMKKLTINGMLPLSVKKVTNNNIYTGNEALFGIETRLCVVIKDYDDYVQNLMDMKDDTGNALVTLYWNYAFNMDLPADEKYDIGYRVREKIDLYKNNNSDDGLSAEGEKDSFDKLQEQIGNMSGDVSLSNCSVKAKEPVRETFYQFFGGMIFIGVVLSIVFLTISIVIMYYKQISEGYEDRVRFDIMKKVGMTNKDIRKTIKSQILIMLFIPLIVAGIHFAFAFPFVWNILKIFNFNNLTFAIKIAIGCYIVFSVFYIIMYKITSNIYYSIISSGRK